MKGRYLLLIFTLIGFLFLGIAFMSCSSGDDDGNNNQNNTEGSHDSEYGINTTTLRLNQSFDFSAGSVVSENGDMKCGYLTCNDSKNARTSYHCGIILQSNFQMTESLVQENYESYIQYISGCRDIPAGINFTASQPSLGSYEKDNDQVTPYTPSFFWVLTGENQLAIVYIVSLSYSGEESSITFKWKYPYCNVKVWYKDNDGDGYGDPYRSTGATLQPEGYVSNNTDCNDNDSRINPGVTEIGLDGIDQDCSGSDLQQGIWYLDSDGDGYGDPSNSTTDADQPTGYVSNNTDCDDTNSSINPSATEIAEDGIDQDCNGSDLEKRVWYLDSDGDGYGNNDSSTMAAFQPSGYVVNNTDCNDSDSSINPGATEICDDGKDQNCNGSDALCNIFYRDADSDGYGDPNNSIQAASQPSGYTTDKTDCNDSNANIHPGVIETANDGVDQDCDGYEPTTLSWVADDQGWSVKQTADGGYIVAGGSNSFGVNGLDVSLIKTDSSGNVSWLKTFGDTDDDIGYCVQQAADGGYIVAGYTKKYSTKNQNMYLIKTDSEGKASWKKTFGGSNKDTAYAVQQTTDEGYILVGNTESSGEGSSDIRVIKTYSNGNEAWSKTFGSALTVDGFTITENSTEKYDDIAYSIQQTNDGGYIISGYSILLDSIGTSASYILKLDDSGTVTWSRFRGGGGKDVAYSVIQTSDGGYANVGYTSRYGSGGWDVILSKSDSEGYETWAKTYGGTNHDVGYSIQQTSDGGYIIAGYSKSYNSSQVWDVFVVKADAQGTETWTKTFGGPEDDYAYSVRQTADGGYIVIGNTASFSEGLSDVYFIRLDANGNLR